MKAYVILDVTIENHVLYEDYKKLTPATLVPYNGKFVVRGGNTEVLEGDSEPGRIVVLEFPTMELAWQWWNSDEYAPAKEIRQRAATTKMILVEGFDPK